MKRLLFRTAWVCLIVLFQAFMLHGCKKKDPCNDPANRDCPNYDSCLGKHPAYASFRVIQRASSSEDAPYFIPYATDTVYGPVNFIADMDSADSYEWHIGSSATIYRTRQVNLNFGNLPTNTVLPVTLIVRKKPVLACFPNDSGLATVSRNIVYCDTLKDWIGWYEGNYTDTPSQHSTIYVGFKGTPPFSPARIDLPYIVGLRPYSDTMFNDASDENYTQRQYLLHSACNGKHSIILGWVAVDTTLNNINILQTWYGDGAGAGGAKKTFIGHRIN